MFTIQLCRPIKLLMLRGELISYYCSPDQYVLLPGRWRGQMLGGVLIFIVLNQRPVQVEGLYTRFTLIAVLAVAVYPGLF